MRKLFITILIMAFSPFLGNAQDYNIKFEVKQNATTRMGTDWDYQYKDFKLMTPMYVTFDGKTLLMKNATVTNFKKDVISINKAETKETVYGNEIVTEEVLILGVNGEYCTEYYLIKKEYLQKGGYVYSIYQPFVYKGKISSYNIYRSGQMQ